jgi:hypothetical protein
MLELKDLTRDLIEFLNENGLYTRWESWMNERGYTTEEIDAAVESLDE